MGFYGYAKSHILHAQQKYMTWENFFVQGHSHEMISMFLRLSILFVSVSLTDCKNPEVNFMEMMRFSDKHLWGDFGTNVSFSRSCFSHNIVACYIRLLAMIWPSVIVLTCRCPRIMHGTSENLIWNHQRYHMEFKIQVFFEIILRPALLWWS